VEQLFKNKHLYSISPGYLLDFLWMYFRHPMADIATSIFFVFYGTAK
jgi:hypothetical protein